MLKYYIFILLLGVSSTTRSSDEELKPSDWTNNIIHNYFGTIVRNDTFYSRNTTFSNENSKLSGFFESNLESNIISGELSSCVKVTEKDLSCDWKESKKSGKVNFTFYDNYRRFVATVDTENENYYWTGSRFKNEQVKKLSPREKFIKYKMKVPSKFEFLARRNLQKENRNEYIALFSDGSVKARPLKVTAPKYYSIKKNSTDNILSLLLRKIELIERKLIVIEGRLGENNHE